MPSDALARLLARLEETRGRFGVADRARAERLLAALGRRRLPDAESLIRFHDTLLFLRAFPQSADVVRRTERLLGRFWRRVQQLRDAGRNLSVFEPENVSGIAGAWISDTLSYDMVRWLLKRFPGKLQVEWDDYDEAGRQAATWPRFLPLLEEDSLVEADVPYLRWLRAACGRSGDLEWLLRRFAHLPLSGLEKAELYDSLKLPVRWELGNSRATRTRSRLPGGRTFYHQGPLIARREVSLAGELAAPPLPLRKLSRARGEAVINVAREALAVRYRELYGITHGDPAQVVEARVGRGVEIYLWGLPPERRLPLRAYLAGFSVKNGVPINYIESIGLFEWMEIGFNTFYAYRDGETAWIYAKVLRLLRQMMGVTCTSVYPYQLGQDNEEAIQSGAFWFYRKLGFRSSRPELKKLTQREEKRIAADPRYRTPARTLRRLASAHIFYELPGTTPGLWDRFQMRKLGFAVERRMAERFDGDAGKMRRAASAAIARILGVRPGRWNTLERRALEDFAAVLALVPGLARWSAAEKSAVARIIRAKMGADEMRYLHLEQAHSRLRDAMVRLGSRGG